MRAFGFLVVSVAACESFTAGADAGAPDGAGATDGAGAPDGSPTADAGRAKVAFILSKETTGQLAATADSSLTAADALCTADAQAAGFKGTFVAWLSTSTTSVLARLGPNSGPWALPKGARVAAGLTELTDRGPATPIVETAFGTKSAPDRLVWTGTAPDGFATNNDCLSWTSNRFGTKATIGNPATVNGGRWTSYDEGPVFSDSCDAKNLLYCFER